MARWDVRFQLQAGYKELDSKVYHSEIGPCTQEEALSYLSKLWASNKDYYRGSSWNDSFKAAIEKAERAVKNARGYNVSAGVNRNFYSTDFYHDGTTYRVDIAIESGGGHFFS